VSSSELEMRKEREREMSFWVWFGLGFSSRIGSIDFFMTTTTGFGGNFSFGCHLSDSREI